MSSENEVVCSCMWFYSSIHDSSVSLPIRHVPERGGSFYLTHSDGGSTRFEYCPWCGLVAPKKLKLKLWAEIPSNETWRLHLLTKDCKSSADIVAVFGAADEELVIEKDSEGSDWPRQREEFIGGKHWYYRHHSEHCDVHVQVSPEDKIRVSYLARKSEESRLAVSVEDFYDPRGEERSSRSSTECTCGWPDRAAEDPAIPVEKGASGAISFSAKKGSRVMSYCPQCGGVVKKPEREQCWTVISEEEKARIEELTKSLTTEEDVRRVLGEPDWEALCSGSWTTFGSLDKPSETTLAGRSLEYRNLSDTAIVDVAIGRYGGVKFSFRSRYIGPGG